MYFYISKIFQNVVNSYKDIFSSKKMELDLYISELRIGVEYDGIYWHSTEYAKKKAKEKYNICKKNGVKLIRVSEALQESYDDSDMFIYREELTDEGLNKCILELLSKITDQQVDIDVAHDRAAIMSLYITVLKDKSIAALYPDVVWEWDYSKNEGLSPDRISYGANYKASWICPKGHRYEAWISDRTGKRKTGCPECSYLAKAKKVMCIETGVVYDSPRLATEAVGKKAVTISAAARNQSKTCAGFHWKYV